MDYSDAVAAMFVPSPAGATAGPTVDASPARRFRDAIEPIAMHAVWSKETNERLAALGLDFMTGYVWGRAAALGEPEPGVVVSSFAVFEPGMLSSAYEQGRGVCGRQELLDARTASTVDSLGTVLAHIDPSEVGDVAAVLQNTVGAADVTGRPLFAGLVGRAWPEGPVGRLWQACELAREHRGDGHVAVCVERGLGPIEMNILTELWVGMPLGSYSATRGWSPAQLEQSADRLRSRGLLDGDLLSSAGHDFRDQIEAATDQLEQPVIDALGSQADDIIDRLNTWSQCCIDAKAFPPDVFKRAAG